MNRLFACTVLLVVSSPATAADANGYTAKYEKQVGVPPPCDVVINSPSDSGWAKLNDPGTRVVCLAPGDYTSRGPITLTASGSAGRERWLRYYRPDDDGRKPWEPGFQPAQIKALIFQGANYWIAHRITIDGNYANETLLHFPPGANASNNVIDNMLVQKGGGNTSIMVVVDGPTNRANTIQNSVIRDTPVQYGQDNECVAWADNDTRIINNEIYDCNKAIFTWETVASVGGAVIENNDLYLSPSRYTDCSGAYTPSGRCAAAETIINLKSGGVAGSPIQIVHNRVWGARTSDATNCCAGGGTQGQAISLYSGSYAHQGNEGVSYVLIKNNAIFDSQIGFIHTGGVERTGNINRRISVIGNLFFNIKAYDTRTPSGVIYTAHGQSVEYYFNIIANSASWLNLAGETINNDVRCNVVLSSDGAQGSADASTSVANNAFYGTPILNTLRDGTDIVQQDVAGANSTDFCFYRRLRTSPQRVCVTDTRPTASTPHRAACVVPVGSKPGLGVSDQPLL